MPTDPLAYFITFACYGARLHGDDRGSVRRPGLGDLVPPSPPLAAAERAEMDQPPYELDAERRAVVLRTVREVAAHRGWSVLAAHVRSNHVHVVIHAAAGPEKVMNDLKAYSSRRLTEARLDGPDRKRWARHGSTKYLWTEDAVAEKVAYTVLGQGEAMAV